MSVIMNQTGVNAGKVFNLLNTTPNLSSTCISKKLNLTYRQVNLALGWLARENKLIDKEVENSYIPKSEKFCVFSVKD